MCTPLQYLEVAHLTTFGSATALGLAASNPLLALRTGNVRILPACKLGLQRERLRTVRASSTRFNPHLLPYAVKI